MADGYHQLEIGARLEPGARTLSVRCACGRRGSIDPAPWRAQGLCGQPLESLEPRVRCTCGARRSMLAPICADVAPRGGFWIFR